jgi:hypothetical protein
MYGYAYPLVIYGWREEGCDNQVIGEDWLTTYCKEFEGDEDDTESIEVYASSQIKNHGAQPVYGVVCTVDIESGQSMVPDLESKKKVDALFGKIFKNKGDNPHECKLGYYLAVSGDYDTCWDEYEPELDDE